MLSLPVEEGTWRDFELDTVAWMVFIAGAAFRWWATLYIGGRKSQRLASDGPYSVCRNPLYLGTFLMGLSTALFLESAIFVLGLLISTALYLLITVPSEERVLEKTLGQEYIDYCKRVPRFLPRFSLLRSRDVIEVSMQGLAAEGWRAARWIWIPVICEFANQLRIEPWWPHY